MGFLKFLKRGKKDSLDELDLPPAPPPLEGFDDSLPELPEFPDLGDDKESADYFAKLDFPKTQETAPDLEKGDNFDFPSFPKYGSEPEPIQTISSPLEAPPAPQIPQPMPEPEEPAKEEPRFMPLDSYPRTERRLFSHEKREMRAGKTIYVRVDRFKATLGSINMVRSDLRKSEEALMKLENIKIAKDRSFDKFKLSLDDLQKKLIFVDKTLFKGE